MRQRHRLYVLCLAACCAANAPVLFAQTASSANIFEFHSGFWINLHHFLYWQALVSMPQTGPPSLALTEVDNAELQQLSPTERASWESTVSYYANSLAKRDLLSDDGLITTKNQLEDAEESLDLANAQIPAELKVVLLRAAPIYRNHWWPRHDAKTGDGSLSSSR